MTVLSSLTLAACLAAAAPAAFAAGPDPVEGKWLGKAGFPEDRIELGFEFKRNRKGELKAYLYEPVLNFYGLELPGVLEHDGETYVHKGYAVTLKLHGDTLEGTYLPLNAPASLHRTATLPSEVPVPDLPRGPGPKWQVKLAAAIWAPAAVRDGVAYVGTTGGILYAVRTGDGAFVWTFVAGRPIFGEPLATDEHLYFVCDNGFLFKLDRRNGQELWRYDLGDSRVSRPLPHQVLDDLGIGEFDFDAGAPKPVLTDGVLYVGSGDGSFHAVKADTGERLWRFANDAGKPEELAVPWNKQGSRKNRTDAVLDGPRVIYGSLDHHVYALDRTTGRKLWDKDTRAEITGAPALVAGKLIVGNRGGVLAALDPATGERIWRAVFRGSAVESSAVPGTGTLFYIGASDLRRISLIDAKDARVLWRTDVFGWAWPRPALTDKLVVASAIGANPYQMRHLGSLSAIDRETGRVVWRWPMPEWPGSWLNGFAASPVVDGEMVVVGGLDGSLYGFPLE